MTEIQESANLICPTICANNSRFLTNTNTGLGNTLFKLSSAYALCKKTNRKLSNYFLKEFCNKIKVEYNLNHNDTIFKFFLNSEISSLQPTISIGEKSIYDESIINDINISKEKCISINSHLGYPLYFSEYRDDILSIFSIPEDILHSLKDQYKDIFNPDITPISLHMRLNQTSVAVDDSVLITYYQKAIEHIKSTIQNPKFFIFSDDIDKARDIVSNLIKEPIFINNIYDYLDLYLISLCHHHITSASTFSWWGAYLSNYKNKIVIYPRYFYTHICFIDIPEEQFHREYYLNNAISM